MDTEKLTKESHASRTVGGLSGHIFRRAVHLSFAIIPIIYYAYAIPVATFIRLTPQQLLIAIIVLNFILESIRLLFGWTLLGHRRYEEKHISSFCWGVLSICLVLLLSPGERYAIPIIWGCAFIDPLLGELRNTKISLEWIFIIGMVATGILWLLCAWWLNTPVLLALLMGPLVVGLEWPRVKWIDDTALMQIVPLLVVLLLYG